MNRFRRWLPVVALAGFVGAQDFSQDPVLTVRTGPALVEFKLVQAPGPFFASAVLALDPRTAQYLVGLPPLLIDYVVLGAAFVDRDYLVMVPMPRLPAGMELYAQGVTFETVLRATPVVPFVAEVVVKG
jgi:hypothetical protein